MLFELLNSNKTLQILIFLNLYVQLKSNSIWKNMLKKF